MAMKEAVIAICDDASDDAMLLHKYVAQSVPTAKIEIYASGQDMVRRLQKDNEMFDLIFLEISMENENGVRIAQRIRRLNSHVPIVFVSRSEEYYREAFDVFAFQYLLKPVTFEKIQAVIRMWDDTDDGAENKIIHFKYRSRIYTYKHGDIEYISSSLHTVNFHMTNGKIMHCRGKLSDFDEQLKDSLFIRCHQSFYVNIEHVLGMKSDTFIMRDTTIPISRSYIKGAQNAYKEYLAKLKTK